MRESVADTFFSFDDNYLGCVIKADRPRTLCYKSEIKDVQITANWAFEWGHISYRDSSTPRPMRGKVLRVMKRQPDASWKFARVIVLEEPKESAAPMSEPCL